MEYIILDLELNQSYKFPHGKIYKTSSLCPFEIIQIGAVKVNENFEIINTFNMYVNPQIYPRLHPFVSKITGIKKSDLIDKSYFLDVFQHFIKFIGDSEVVFCTWGNDDLKFLFRNMLYYNLDTTLISNKYVNIQTYATKYLSKQNGQAIGLKNAVIELDITLGLDFHNALNDAMYTTEIFKIVRPSTFIPLTILPQSILNSTKPKPKVKYKELYSHVSGLLNKEELSPEEKKAIRTAYLAGKNGYFDIKNEDVKS